MSWGPPGTVVSVELSRRGCLCKQRLRVLFLRGLYKTLGSCTCLRLDFLKAICQQAYCLAQAFPRVPRDPFYDRSIEIVNPDGNVGL